MSRPRLLRRIALGVLAFVVVVVVVLAVVVVSVIHRSSPQVSGDVRIAGLSGPVTVERDARGVPDIYADTALDLFRAQGFVHAQDRFFEMDLRRHITAGRLSEMVGEDGFDTDKVIRTMGWRRVAERELPLLDPTTRQYLQAYADGVNAWIHSKDSTSGMAVEYVILGRAHPGYTVEDWTPVDSLAWLKAMAWDLRGDYDDELTRAELAGRMSTKQIAELYPPYPYDQHRPILGDQEWSPSQSGNGNASAVPAGLTGARPGSAEGGVLAASRNRQAEAAYASVRAALDAVPTMLGRGRGVGSNSWVVGGSRTTTGKPLLANDPHLAVGIPGIWTQGGLHCRRVNAQCPFDVSGFSFSGVPGVVIGHNDRIAWGFTNLEPDVTDFYLEQVQGDTTLRDGAYVPMTVREERIKIAGRPDQTITVRGTVHGPILSDVIPEVGTAGDNAPVTGGEPSQTYAVSLAWTALTPTRTADAIFMLNKARDFTEFRQAAERFAVPAQNLVYADVDGHIGYQAPGRIPIRSSAFTASPPGYWPAPGWQSVYDWQGTVPFDQMPWTYDPPQGLIVAANQAVTQSPAPFLTSEWDYGFRSERIRTLLEATEKVSPQRMRDIQMDNRNMFAPTLVKALLTINLSDDPFTKEGQNLLRTWNGTSPADESRSGAGAAYFNAVWDNLLSLTFDDELPPDRQATGESQWMEAVTQLLKTPRSAWWDNKSTPGITEGKDEILRQAMVKARLDLTKKLGKDPGSWQWGKLHQLDLQHRVLGGDGVPGVVRWYLNRGGYEMPGGSSIVNANGWNASEGYDVTDAPSMRMVVDLSNLDGSTWVNQTGQSGHPSSDHYDDQIDAWISGEQYAWPYSQGAVKKASKDELRLLPKSGS